MAVRMTCPYTKHLRGDKACATGKMGNLKHFLHMVIYTQSYGLTAIETLYLTLATLVLYVLPACRQYAVKDRRLTQEREPCHVRISGVSLKLG